MKASWLIADLHFGDEGMCRYTMEDGSKIRPWDDVKEMDEALRDNWASVVGAHDRVYVLGDLGNLDGFKGLPGRKIAILGNHDNRHKLRDLAEVFSDIRACDRRHQFDRKFVLTHVPLHPDCLPKWGLNIHGHTHRHIMRHPDGSRDPRYACVSVEQIDFRPRCLEQVLEENPL